MTSARRAVILDEGRAWREPFEGGAREDCGPARDEVDHGVALACADNAVLVTPGQDDGVVRVRVI